jgi:hypothetical protein
LLEDSFIVFRLAKTAHVRSTAHPRDDVPAQEDECVAADRDVIDEGHEYVESIERSGLVHASDAGSSSNAEGDSDGGSCTRSYNFGPLMVTVCFIREMIKRGHFAKGGACAPREETVPEPENDEAIVFEEFFIAGLRMPLHPVLAVILLKF